MQEAHFISHYQYMSTHKKRILVVEDEKQLAFYLKKTLETQGYVVDCILNGKDASYYIENNTEDIDIILLDIMLPGMNGIEVVKAMRRENITIPVLLLTAKDTEDDKVLGLDTGADDYLTKPFSVKELSARIRSIIRRSNADNTDVINIRDIVIYPMRMKVYKNNKEVHLTLREYEILKMLATHPNQVINREDIIEKVFDLNALAFSNVVDVHVFNLRRKLNDTGKNRLIESIWGVGYRLAM